MELRLTHPFPVSPGEYWEATREPGFESTVRAEADVDYTLLEDREEGTRQFTRARVSPRKELPTLAAKAVGTSRLSYVQEIDADATTFTTRWRVVPDFLQEKIRCSGTSRVVPTDAGCERVIEGEIVVSIPLVGGAIEKQIVGEIAQNYERAATVLRQYLRTRQAQGAT